MSTTTQTPVVSVALDDPGGPGTYMTDGARLLRLVGVCDSRGGYVAIEDCASLDGSPVTRREPHAWDLTPVCRRAVAVAA